jgi:hypothetical protein
MVTEDFRQSTLNQISKLLVSCRTDKAIMEELKIPFATYYRYKRKLTDECVQNIKSQRMEDYALSLQTLEDRLKSILEPLLVRLNDSSRISNRDMATISSIAKELAFTLQECEKQKYGIMFPDKKQLDNQGTPALIESEDPEDDGAFSIDPDTGERIHSRSTDSNPIV